MDLVEEETMETAEILRSSARIPEHVVYRTFVYETVVLNLQTGKYHGLNRTGGRMLELLEREPTVRDAAAKIAAEFGRPVTEVETDLCEFSSDLASRGLIVLTR
ncbi:MAG TPA: PqqD family protein [Gaiellaceae bacterium]|nr:PqqD family protein [Gaiellaceae bacterium]